MKKIYFVLLSLMFVILQALNAQEIDIINFGCTENIECYSTNVYAQYFTIPVGDDYCVTQIGIQLDAQSAVAKIFLGLYDASGILLFKSKEIDYPGGIDSTIMVNVPDCVQSLTAETSYYIGIISSASSPIYIKRKTTPANTGIASLNEYAYFNSLANYPDFSDPIAISGSYAFNFGFVLKGIVKPEAMEPENEILEFNCTSSIELEPNNIYYSQITLQGTENKMLRQIGLKTDTCSAQGNIKCAIYDASMNLIYITDEAIVNVDKADTTYIEIPENEVELSASANYHLAFEFSGTNRLAVQKTRVPQNRALSSIYEYSWFKSGFNYNDFPITLSAEGAYAFVYGFVLNGDNPGVATENHPINFNNPRSIKAFPTIAENQLTLFSQENIDDPLDVKIYDLSGILIKSLLWTDANTINIPVSDLDQGFYLIGISGIHFRAQVIKFVKR